MIVLFLELTTLAFFVLTGWHAHRRHGRFGLVFMISLLALAFLRENFVTLERLLYGYGELHLELGAAPLIGSIIWPYSIYIACSFAERLRGEALEDGFLDPVFHGWVALFMVSLVGFYEPLLARVDMARWQEGTRATLGVPWIACLGYPSLAVLSTAICGWLIQELRGWRLALALAAAVTVIGLGHAWGLQALKSALGW